MRACTNYTSSLSMLSPNRKLPFEMHNKPSISPIKHLGQNFLNDTNIAHKIVSLLGNINSKTVYEIGPGMGALTTHLINSNAKVTCFEIDKRAVKFLNDKFGQLPNINVVNTDIRQICLASFADKHVQESTDIDVSFIDKSIVIGNIPYNITNEIIFWLVDNSETVDIAVFTIQYEVARRYTARPGTKDYGITTLVLQLYCKAKVCFDISATAFFPSPKVRSSVVLLDFSDKKLYEYTPKKEIVKLIRAAFSQRRKMLSNSLKSYLSSNSLNMKELQARLATDKKFYLELRAEQLVLDEYIDLYNYIKGMC